MPDKSRNFSHTTIEIDSAVDEVTEAKADYPNLSGRLSAMQEDIDNSFSPSEEQTDAMNSGITEEKVQKISENTEEINDIKETIGDINSVLEEVL